MQKMKVVIFGATGFSGKAILKEALSQQHQVTVLVRNKSSILVQDKNLKIVEGNVLDKHTVAEVLKNSDAVIQCLGVGGKGNGKLTTFISVATKIIVEEMEKQQIKRLIALSNVGAGNSFYVESISNTHTIQIPLAGSGSTGLMSGIAQTFSGNKTFQNDVVVSGMLNFTFATTPAPRRSNIVVPINSAMNGCIIIIDTFLLIY